MKSRIIRSVLFLVVCLALGTVFGIYTSHYYQSRVVSKPEINGLLWPNPRVLEPFTLVDQDKDSFDLDNLSGKWTLMFFGYTHCPDICPITLSIMDQVYRELRSRNRADNIQFIFVSVDPGRDTPEKLAGYMQHFNEDFTGLTGSQQELQSLTRQLGIVYNLNKNTGSGDYLVDHSASLFLIAPGQEWLGIFTTPHVAEYIIERLLAMQDFYAQTDA